MTFWRTTSALLIGLLLVGGPTSGLLPLPVAASQADGDEEDGNAAELALDVTPPLDARRPVERHAAGRTRSAVVPAHRHHALPVRPQAAPVTFRAAANPPLTC